MVRQCCVRGCKSTPLRNPHITFSPFPKDDDLRKEWIRIIEINTLNYIEPLERRPWSTPVRQSLGRKYQNVCGLHFNTTGRRKFDDRIPRYFGKIAEQNDGPDLSNEFDFVEIVVSSLSAQEMQNSSQDPTLLDKNNNNCAGK